MRKVLSIGIAVSSAAAGLSASLVSQAAPITSNWVDRTDSWSCGNCVTQWKNSDGSNRFPNNGADTFSVNLGPGSGAQPQSVIQLDQNITIDNFSQTGNTLAPAAGVKRPTLTINNLFSWTAGTISGNLQVIANGPPLGKSLSINGTPLLNGATLINRGDATMSGGGLIGNTRAVGNSRTQVFNTGTFSITDNSILDVLGKATNVEPLFENRGIFRKTGGAAGGQSSIGWDFINNGAVQVQTGTLTIGATGKYSQPMGSLTVDKGTIFRSTKDLTIGGSIGGEGTIQAPNVKNNAIIDPNQKGAAGELNINGNLALSSRSDLQIALGGKVQGSQYDVLDVTDGPTGTVTLGGLLEVYFIDDFQDEITSSDTFMILTADTPLGGSFSDVANGERLSTADGFGSFIVTYNADNVVLSDFAPISEPSSMALLGSGLIMLGWRLKLKKHKPLSTVRLS